MVGHIFQLALWVILIYFVEEASGSPTNVARGKDASSSTARSGFESVKAIDGIADGTSYFWSKDKNDTWWRVDLRGQYFIRRVKAFNRYDTRGRFRKVGIYLSTKDSPAAPHLAGSDWTLVKHLNDYKDVPDPPNNYIEYDTVVASHTVLLARHVALHSTNYDGMAIDEVEVYALHSDEFKPSSLQFDTSTEQCVTLSWDPPTGYQNVKINYKVKLDNDATWTSLVNVRTITRCSLQPYYLLKYEVLVDGASSSAVLPGDVRLPCAASSEPTGISFSSARMNCATAGTPKWEYTVTWEIPGDVNCDSVTGYKTKFPTTGSSEVTVSTTTTLVYTTLSAGDITFSVSATNSAGPSAFVTKTITTPAISSTLTLCKQTFSSSVYGDGSESWRAVDGDISGTSYFRSKDRDGPQWWRVDLGEKYFISEIKVYNVYNINGRLRDVGVYTSKLASPASPPTAWSRVYYLAGYIDARSPNNYLVYNPVSSRNVIPIARHLALYRSSTEYGLAIDDVQVTTYTTAEFKPTNPDLDISPTNDECVTLSWEPPYTDVKTNYEVSCNNSVWSSVGESTTMENMCDFAPNKPLICRVRVQGSTISVSAQIKTPCQAATLPREVNFQSTPTMNCAQTGKPRWQYTVTWQEPESVNCGSITDYITSFQGVSGVSTTGTAVVYTSGSSEEVTFSVSARNNAGKTSILTSAKVTTPAITTTITLCKATSSSSIYGEGFESWRAVDGDTTETSYFRTSDNANQWWRMDLEVKFFIQEIRVYNIYSFRGRFQQIGIYVTDKRTATSPPAGSDWSRLTYQAEVLNTGRPNNYLKYDPAKARDIVPIARHVALYTTNYDGMLIDDIKVTAYDTDDFKPSNQKLSISQDNNECVTLSWGPPFSNIKAEYEVSCGTAAWSSVGESTTTEDMCDFPPNKLLRCSVRVQGNSISVAAEISTPCKAPTIPRNVNVQSVPAMNCEETGTPRWEYTVTWQEPKTINCDRITDYITTFQGMSGVSTTGRAVVYTTRNAEEVTFSVSARNNVDKTSGLASAKVTTPAIGHTLTLCKPTFSSSVYGEIFKSWRAVDGDTSGSSYFRSTDVGAQWWRVDLGEKYFIKEITVYNVYSIKEKLQNVGIRISKLESPTSPPNSWSQVHYFDGLISWTPPSNYFRYNPETSGHNTPQARHIAVYSSTEDQGLAIDDFQIKVYTEFKPTRVQLKSSLEDKECVILSWEPPYAGVKTNYEFNCNNTEWHSVSESTTTGDMCKFLPNKQLECKVRVEGSTIIVPTSTTTPCQAPTQPRQVKFQSEPAMNCEVTGTPRWQYTVSWQKPEDLKCGNINGYITRFPLGDSNTVTVYKTQKTIVYTSLSDQAVTFYVSAKNNVGKESGFTSVNVTTPAIDTNSLTLCKPTSSSSSFNSSYPSWKAVDGDLSVGNYFRSNNSRDQWWMVDLEERFFIREIKVYNYWGLPGRLQQVSLYVSSIKNPTTPKSDDWRLAKYQNNKIEAKAPNNSFKYDPIAASEVILLARYVAVFSAHSNGLAIDDVHVYFFTSEGIQPTNLNLTLNKVSELSSCVTMQWEPPKTDTVIRLNYEVKFHTFDWTFVDENTTSKRCGLRPNERWTCKVRVLGAGDKSILEMIGLPCVAPLAPNVSVADFTEIGVNGSERVRMLIGWQESEPNCDSIINYHINISTMDNFRINDAAGSDGRNISFTDLDPVTDYKITVRAVNNDNLERDTEMIWRTRELKPSDAPKVTPSFNESCVILTVSKPPKPNGVITHYDIFCLSSDKMKTINNSNSNETEQGGAMLCGFEPASKIICSVTASNSAGTSPLNNTIGYTLLQVVQIPEQKHLTVTPSEEATQVLLKPVQLINADVRKYRLVVNKQLTIQRNKRSLLIKGSTCDSDQLYNASLAAELSLSCYIAAEINESRVKNDGLKFNLGDNSTVGGYHNAPLEPGSVYDLLVAVIGKTKDGHILTHYLDPYSFTTSPVSVPESACPQKCVVGISVGVTVSCLILAGLAAAIIYYRRRVSGKESDGANGVPMDNLEAIQENNLPYETMSGAQGAQGARGAQGAHGGSGSSEAHADRASDVYGEARVSTAIPIASLSSFIRNNESLILNQYKDVVEKQAAPTMNVAKLPENKGKCRFVGLYPEDVHRVKLDRGGEEGTDFINASFIAGYNGDKEFITAQGPMQRTVNDFWLMIWQQRPKAVVMVTGVVENGKPKCEQYWPEDPGSTTDFNGIKVALTSSEQWADYTIRTLRATKDARTISVKHFHYTSWPDHGVPAEMSPFVIFVRKVNEATSRLSGPLLVHCSAGVGRTGTFVGLDILLAETKKNNSVDVQECVRQMRMRRPKMVQAKEQYLFLHQVLSEILTTEGFLCTPNLLEDRLTVYRSRRGSENDLITKEFRRIEEVMSTLVPNFSMARQEENEKKNRVPEILPDGKHSVYSGGGYINAVLVDDYKKKRHVIATQLPLANTLVDFWRLIQEQEVKVIVQLEYEPVKFYPDGESKIIEFDEFMICWNEMEVKELVSIVSLTVTSKQEVSSVKLLLINSWTLDEERFPDSRSLTNYLGVLEKCQQQTGDGKICIVDMDGSTRCGIFISAYNALEKLKSEQEVDMYNSVLMARYRRKEFVGDIESYVYLYNLLKDFTDAFSEYANFQ